MADRTVTVRLRAIIGEYETAMGRAAAATASFGTSAKAAVAGISGQQMVTAGQSLTRNVTLPILGIGVAATKLGADFETTFSQMVALAGVTSDEVDGLKERVLELAGETGRAPQELAEALYFAQSAGLDTAEAMDVLEMSARAAATGMGNTEVVVGLLASIMGAYGSEAISAAEATDILTATIQEGRAEPDELAGSLGRVLPIAAELGVEFDEIGGAAAYMSNVFGDTGQMVVRLDGFLRKLLDPSRQGVQALQDMGTSVEELQAVIADDGLMGALEHLRSHGILSNREAMNALFDDSRALQGALVLLNDESGRLAPIMDAVANSTGAAGAAFDDIAGTDTHRMRQAWADLQAQLIELGEVLVPVVAAVADFATEVLSIFRRIPEPAQKVLISLMGITALAGPMLTLAGHIRKAADAMVAMNLVSAGTVGTLKSMAGRAGLFAAVGIGVGILGNHLRDLTGWGVAEDLSHWRKELEAMADGLGEFSDMDGLVNSLDWIADPSMWDNIQAGVSRGVDGIAEVLTLGIVDIESSADKAESRFRELDSVLMDLVRGGNAEKAAEIFGMVADAAERQGVSVDDLRSALPIYGSGLRQVAAAALAASPDVEGLTGDVDDQAGAVENAIGAWEGLADTLRAQFDPLFAAQDAALDLADAQAHLNEVLADSEATQQDVADAHADVARKTVNTQAVMMDLAQAVADGTVDFAEAERVIGLLTEGQEHGAETAAWFRDMVAQLGGQLENLPNLVPISVQLTGAAAAGKALGELVTPRTAWIYAQIANAGSVGATLGRLARGYQSGGEVSYLAAGGFPLFQPRGTDTVPAMLSPGEFVINERAVDSIGVPLLNRLNSMGAAAFHGAAMPAPSAPTAVRVSFDTTGLPEDMASILRRRIKVEAGGNAQQFWGAS